MIHTLTLVAGVKQTLPSGFFIKIITASSDLDVRCYTALGALLVNAQEISQGDAFNEPRGFGFVEVQSVGGQTVEIQILPVILQSTSTTGTVTVSSGSITVYENQNHGALDKARFRFGMYSAGVSARYSAMQLRNPAASGKLLLVKSLIASPRFTSTARLGLYLYTTDADAMTTSTTAADKNKYLDDIDEGDAILTYGNMTAIVGSKIGDFQCVSTYTLHKPQYVNAEAIIIPEGKSVIVAVVTTNSELSAEIEYEEIDVPA